VLLLYRFGPSSHTELTVNNTLAYHDKDSFIILTPGVTDQYLAQRSFL
jgi:hypothetical protein